MSASSTSSGDPAKGLRPALARVAVPPPYRSASLGTLASSQQVSIAIALRPRNAAALGRAARAISTPGNPEYHHFLTPVEVGKRFGATIAEISAVSTVLRRAGLRVGHVSANHLLLDVRGRAGVVSRALHTHLQAVKLANSIGWRLATPAYLPTAVAHAVSAVVGLDNEYVAHHTMASVHPTSAPVACSAASRSTRAGGGWTDTQLASAYGLTPLYANGDTGQGETVAVIELEPYLTSDIVAFDRCFFGESHASQIRRFKVGGFSLHGGGSGESALDIETVSALAPSARIDVYEAPNTNIGTLSAYNEIVSADRERLITTSWGECEQMLDASAPGTRLIENYIFEEAASQGQTFIAATGDSGSDDCATTPFRSSSPTAPYLSVDDPASQPYVLAVGGTSLRSATQPLTPEGETAWNGGARSGASGGGISSNWSSPSWQAGSGVPGVSPIAGRQVPDVSAAADSLRGVAVYSAPLVPGGWTTIGGTSESAPIWAAVLAEIAASGPTGTSCGALPASSGGVELGFVPPLLYAVASSSYATSFHPITVGNNDVFHLGLGYSATPGYNLVGGLGSPIVTNPDGEPGLASNLCAAVTGAIAGRPKPFAIDAVSPGFGPTTGGTAVSITLSQPIPAGATVEVSFGGRGATIEQASGTTVVAVAPSAASVDGAFAPFVAGPASVSVTEQAAGGSASSVASRTSTFDFVAPSSGATATVPSVTGVNPSAGNATGGTAITIYGSGFSSSPVQVTIGGRPARAVRVLSDSVLQAVVPAERRSTHCSRGPGFHPSELCQTIVVVANAEGPSAPSKILPVRSGRLTYGSLGVVLGSSTREVAPSVTEYDYAPTPVITKISVSPPGVAGSQVARLYGRGFTFSSLDWVNFGPPDQANSQQIKFVSVRPNEIELKVPALLQFHGDLLTGGVSVQTAAGLSKAAQFAYPGVPSVGSATVVGSSPSARTVMVRGVGFSGVGSVRFIRVADDRKSAARVGAAAIISEGPSVLRLRASAIPRGSYLVEPCARDACAVANPRAVVVIG